MRKRRITSTAIVAVVVIVAAVVVVRADQPQASLSSDRILKGTTPTITITLDKSVPDQKEIKSVLVGGQPATVQEPRTEGKLSVLLPKLDIVGQADVEVIGKDDKPVVVGHLTYVAAAQPTPIPVGGTRRGLVLLFVYVGLIVLLPLICTIYDVYKSYQERTVVLGKLRPHATNDEIRALLTNMDQGPTGLLGLTRGLLALTLVLALAFAVFHLVVFTPTDIPNIADKLIMLLAGTLTAITGFYFGSKASTDATAAATASQASPGAGKTQAPGAPKISHINPDSGTPNAPIKVIGEGFGEPQGRGSVKIGDKNAVVTGWNDKQIAVTIPADAQAGKVNIVVTNDSGATSEPYSYPITKP